MTAFWTEADFDDHELVQVVRDAKSGLTAIIALHSTHLGPGAGGTRFWHYADASDAMRDALRLSRGMSYKNAMAGAPPSDEGLDLRTCPRFQTSHPDYQWLNAAFCIGLGKLLT